ncbi:efflux RND transporter periplasmic adaptor subunit [Polluticoccus soli]|uniref:efflux RND transporter periplasmic adaptor subunit n=1 Tax=Polluticoccus soli TaxID=3034150 RepID=UPI0023E2A70D|nr:efflux RND transporter periplasmic adaptor subunit [Flavipsychrobacter sp. JY13-12]
MRYIIYLFPVFLLLLACGGKKESTTTIEEHHEESTLVSLTEDQLKAANITIGQVEMKNLTSSISVSGTLEVPSQNKAFITSLVGGVLRSINIQPGSYVRKGQTIGTIANTEVSNIQQELISINARIQYSNQELDRQRELVRGNAAPYKNVQRIESELKGLRAQRSALQRQLSTLGVSTGSISSTLAIKAPISGTISEITSQIGSNIDPNAPIAEIINNSELHLDLFVYEKDLPKVAPGQIIHFTLTNNPGQEYDARIYSIGTAFVNETRAVPVHAHVINDKTGLIEGMSVTARISLGESVYPAVPDAAIVTNDGKDYIFIVSGKKASEEQEADHKHEPAPEHSHASEAMVFERIQVIRGASDVGYTEIKPVSTLPQHTKVVVQGAFFLMAKMTNAGEAHEH